MKNSTDGSKSSLRAQANRGGKSELLSLLEEKANRQAGSRLLNYHPYQKQKTFHEAGAEASERLLMAGNQVGKTLAGGAEWAMHLTGLYPDWWTGKRFPAPVRFWCAGVTGSSTRDNPQRVLLGPPADEAAWGTGMIPRKNIMHFSRHRGVASAVDTLLVHHVAGGHSSLAFKSYEMGREKWQGETLDGVWFDEEPPLDIYTEGLTRTQAKGHFVIVTFTPLQGATEVVRRFLAETEWAEPKCGTQKKGHG